MTFIGNSVDNSNSNNDRLLALIVFNSPAVHPQSVRLRLHQHRPIGCQRANSRRGSPSADLIRQKNNVVVRTGHLSASQSALPCAQTGRAIAFSRAQSHRRRGRTPKHLLANDQSDQLKIAVR